MEARYNYHKMDERFSALKAGALFMKKRSEKNDIVFNLVKRHEKEIDFVVWIAPQCFLATEGYVRDVREAAGEQMSAVCFFAMENISLDDAKYLELYELASHYRIFCVVDESLNIKNSECGRTKRLISMKNLFKFRLILSATPLTQGLIDLYSQTQFIDASILGMTQTEFSHKFLPFYMDDFEVLKRWSNPSEEAKLVKLIQPYLLACDFEDNLKIAHSATRPHWQTHPVRLNIINIVLKHLSNIFCRKLILSFKILMEHADFLLNIMLAFVI